MGSLPNLHELGGKESATPSQGATTRPERPRHLLARAPTAPTQHQRVFKSKSNGHAANHVNDDLILDVSAYSPVSGRCVRSIRRRDSLSSSIGATSVRRLIGAVGRSRSIARSSGGERRMAARALFALCGAHAAGTAAVLPFLALQAGGGIWAAGWGAALSAGAFLTAAATTPLGPWLVQRCGPSPPLLIFYAMLAIFFAGHFLPSPALLIPMYLMMGTAMGPAAVARSAAVLNIATRLTNCTPGDDEDARTARKTTLLRRSARAMHFAHDLGLLLGSALAATVINFTLTPSSQSFTPSNLTIIALNFTNCSTNFPNISLCDDSSSSFSDNSLSWTEPSSVFALDESGERICGAWACPIETPLETTLPFYGDVLAGMFAGLAVLGLMSAAGYAGLRGREQETRPGPPALRAMLDTHKDFRLQLAAPLAVFIGMEQAFMFTDFTKSYVICTLGISRVPLVFLSQGLLQSIAAATLSMLLRSIQRRRCLVVAVGFAFHACLLLVQLLWKPSGDDPALFYVISAAWGCCHAIWEQLNWTLLTGAYGDNTPAAIGAFANSLTWRFLGTAMVFAVHGLLCVKAQLHILAAALVLAAIPAATLEQKLHNLRKLRSISRL